MTTTLRVLHIEDQVRDAALISRHLSRSGYELVSDRVETPEAMKEALETRAWDIILCDYSMPHFNALQALELMKRIKLDIPFIIISGTIGEAAAVEAMRAGAHDYLMKDSLARLAPAIERELSEAENRRARRQAEEKLRLQSAAVRAAANAIVITNRAGKILWINPAFTQTTGYSFKEVQGKNPRVLKSGKQDREFYREMWDTILSGKVWRNTIINRHKDGKLTHEDLTITPIPDASGEITHFVGIKQDISERIAAEAALIETKERLRLFVEHAPAAIAMLDREMKYIAVSNRWLSDYGIKVPEIIGRSHYEIFPDVPESWKEIHSTCLAGAVERNEADPWIRMDGSIDWVRWEIRPWHKSDGAIGGLIIFSEVITERKDAEETLRSKNEELASMTQQLWQASKLATMGELAASIAHELNNPLATVGLRAENLLMQLPEDAEQRKPLEIIAQEVDRMAVLVNNLLQFSRRSHRQVSTIDPREEIDNSIELVRYHLRSRKIDVEQEFADPLPTIQADRQQLRQLFLNLLTNASDAMPQGGKLTVRAAVEGSNPSRVALEFADNGEGIAAENLKKIWDPFFTTKPEGKGTGLGLAICRRIVEEHGGTVEIKSQSRHGTAVRVVFPATGNGAAI